MRVVFMGTPEFAVPSLAALCDRGWDVPLVVTQKDRPRGRGRKTLPPPVKVEAQKRGLGLLQVESARDGEFAETLRDLRPDFLAVVAFGHILPKAVLDVPAVLPVNVHPSLLPRHRGPSPIPGAILAGDAETGVCTMRMDTGMDTGDILLCVHEPVLPQDTAGTLHDRLAMIGGALLAETLEKAVKGTVAPKPQDDSQATCTRLVKKADGRMNWNETADFLERFVRAMDPWPGAFTFAGDLRMRVFAARLLDERVEARPGTVVSRTGKRLVVAAGEGAPEILELQGASGKRLTAAEFLRGRPIGPGTTLG